MNERLTDPRFSALSNIEVVTPLKSHTMKPSSSGPSAKIPVLYLMEKLKQMNPDYDDLTLVKIQANVIS